MLGSQVVSVAHVRHGPSSGVGGSSFRRPSREPRQGVVKSSKKSALVLSGGGVFGAYEVGVTLALTRGASGGTGSRPLEPSVFTGTSAGAFNAAFLASRGEQPAGRAAAELARVWYERIADQGDGAGNGVFRFRTTPSSS